MVPPVFLMNLLDRRCKDHVRLNVAVLWPSPPRKIATDPDIQRPAHQFDRVFMTMLLDKLVDQFSLAKKRASVLMGAVLLEKATAFFRILRS